MSRQKRKTHVRINRLRLRDGDKCHVCDLTMRFMSLEQRKEHCASTIDATVDHLLPRGEPERQNEACMRLAHGACNSARGHDMIISEHLEKARQKVITSWGRWIATTMGNLPVVPLDGGITGIGMARTTFPPGESTQQKDWNES